MAELQVTALVIVEDVCVGHANETGWRRVSSGGGGGGGGGTKLRTPPPRQGSRRCEHQQKSHIVLGVRLWNGLKFERFFGDQGKAGRRRSKQTREHAKDSKRQHQRAEGRRKIRPTYEAFL